MDRFIYPFNNIFSGTENNWDVMTTLDFQSHLSL